MDVNRHKCILCKKKKEAVKMAKSRSHWTCLACLAPVSVGTDQGITAVSPTAYAQEPDEGSAAAPGTIQSAPKNRAIRVLNLYAGIGGNRKFWTGVQVTAVENNIKVAAAYKSLYPEDTIIIGDARQYLLENYRKFDLIWSSPPCPTHSIMNYWIPDSRRKFPDMSLYQQIIFLRAFCKTKFVIENVRPYYTPLIEPDTKSGRHMIWSNFKITPVHKISIPNFIECCTYADKEKIMDWLGIRYEKNIYLSGKNFVQVFKNCVHPDIGLSIFNDFITSLK